MPRRSRPAPGSSLLLAADRRLPSREWLLQGWASCCRWRLLPSGGGRPEGAADVTSYAAVARAWLAPSLVALALLAVTVTAAWFLGRYADRRSPGSLLPGTWVILLAV